MGAVPNTQQKRTLAGMSSWDWIRRLPNTDTYWFFKTRIDPLAERTRPKHAAATLVMLGRLCTPNIAEDVIEDSQQFGRYNIHVYYYAPANVPVYLPTAPGTTGSPFVIHCVCRYEWP